MPTKPTQPTIWDSNATHCTAPTAGHITDGYGSNEIPTSDEINELFRRAGLWDAFTDLLFSSSGRLLQLQEQRFQWWFAGNAAMYSGAAYDSTTNAVKAGGVASGFIMPVPARVGDVISQIGVLSFGDAVHDLSVSFGILDTSGSTGFTAIASLTRSAQAASWSFLTSSASLPYTVLANTIPVIGATWSGGTTGLVRACGCEIATP